MTKTILEKLGWVGTGSGVAHGVPANLAELFAAVTISDKIPPNWSIWFVSDTDALTACADAAADSYQDGGHLWFAYPKLTGDIKTDITRDKGWAALERHTLMPVSQIAINPTWSALRFRRRHEIKKLTRKT